MLSAKTLRTQTESRLEFHQNRYVRELEEVAESAARWLDLGAGTYLHQGWIGPSPEALSAGRWIVGSDIDLEHLARNECLAGAIGGDAKHLPIRDGAFDLVTANMVLEHLDDPKPVFAEIRRVLRPGGHFVFVTPNRLHPAVAFAASFIASGLRRQLAQRLEGRTAEDIYPTRYAANTTRRLRHLAGQAGFRVERLEVFSSYPIMRGFLPAVLAESWFIKSTLRWKLCGELGSNLLGRFVRAN